MRVGYFNSPTEWYVERMWRAHEARERLREAEAQGADEETLRRLREDVERAEYVGD